MTTTTTKYIVRYSVDYSLYVEAKDEDEAIEKSRLIPEEDWGQSMSQVDAEESA